MPKQLTYGELLNIANNMCRKFYDTKATSFNQNITTRQDEKNIIYSKVKMSLNPSLFTYNANELKMAVSVIVDETNIRKYSTNPPPSFRP